MAGTRVVINEKTHATATMMATVSHGTEKLMPSNSWFISFSRFQETAEPSARPSPMPNRAISEDSTRKLVRIMEALNPIARNMPIACLRSAHGPGNDTTPERRHADEQAKTHVALEKLVEGLIGAEFLVDPVYSQRCVEVIAEELSLQRRRDNVGVSPRRQPEPISS